MKISFSEIERIDFNFHGISKRNRRNSSDFIKDLENSKVVYITLLQNLSYYGFENKIDFVKDNEIIFSVENCKYVIHNNFKLFECEIVEKETNKCSI